MSNNLKCFVCHGEFEELVSKTVSVEPSKANPSGVMSVCLCKTCFPITENVSKG